jgi:hypothetical protein
MFETFPESQIPPAPFFEGNTIEWEMVLVSLNLPWFHVSRGFRSSAKPSEPKAEIRYIACISLLKEHLEDQDPEHFIQDIQLVSPGWLNQSKRTKMQPLVRLISYEEFYTTNSVKTEYAYEVSGGIRYPVGLDWEKLSSVKTIFDESLLQTF